MWHEVNYVIYNTMYNFEISPGRTAFIQPSKRASINITKAKCFLVSRYTCANVRMDVCARARVRVTKDRERVACTARIDAHVRACALGVLSTLTKRTPTHQGMITTHTRTVKYHVFRYFSPWIQVYIHVRRFTWYFQVFHFVCYIFISMQPPPPSRARALPSCRHRVGNGDKET